jgi:hypothetical protein
MFMGRNPGNRKLIFPASERLVGQIVPVKVLDATVSILIGELCLSGVDEVESALLSQ